MMKPLRWIILSLLLMPLSSLFAAEKKAPDFIYSNLEGTTTFSALLKTNKVALIYFGNDSEKSWKTLAQVDALLSEYRYRGSNLEVLAFIPEKEPAKLEELADQHWLNLELRPDQQGKIAHSFNIGEYPTMAIVDPFGIIRFQGAAPVQDALREKLNTLVDKPVTKAFCPVDKMWIVVTDKTPSVVYKNNRYYFCTSEDHDGRRMDQEFLQDPDRFVKEYRAHMEKEKASGQLEETDPAVRYQCPMKDSPIQNKSGHCQKCGMRLQKIIEKQ